MSLLKQAGKQPKQPDKNQLNKKELEYLLLMVREITFKGEHVELLYDVVKKLQNQYIELDKD